MKKIVIVTGKIVTGGVGKALIEMLALIPEDEYDITVLVKEHGGELEYEIPKWIKVKGIFDDTTSIKQNIYKYALKLKFIKSIKLFIHLLRSYFAKNTYESYHNICKALPVVEEEYDLAISYHVHYTFPLIYVINNIKAKKKIAWIHSDNKQYNHLIKLYKKYYDKYDHMFGVSKAIVEEFTEIYPQYKDKVSVFYNIINSNKIKALSKLENGFVDEYKGTRIITVGRLSYEKGFDLIINIVQKLVKDGYDIKWYCIGDGDQRQLLEEQINKYNLKENLVLLGNKSNPYIYMKECDIYVQPSRHEGYCITLAEARALNLPIVATDFSGAKEQILDGENGLIVKCSEDEIYHAVKRLIDDNNLRHKFTKKLSEEIIDTRKEVDKLKAFI